MIYYLETKRSKLRYSDRGEGEVLVLLHGYLEAIETFDVLAKELSNRSRVICIDLPGHGGSTCKSENMRVDEMAEAIHTLVMELKLNSLIRAFDGSLCGLAFADRYVDKLASFSFLHSTANPDTDEKRMNRRREIEFIIRRKKELICNTAIPNSFAKSNQEIYQFDIEELIRIACKTTDEGVILALNAMMNRPDRNIMLKNLQIPKSSFIGKADNFIPFEKGMEWAIANGMEAVVFENSGHMSFIEEKEKCIEEILRILS